MGDRPVVAPPGGSRRPTTETTPNLPLRHGLRQGGESERDTRVANSSLRIALASLAGAALWTATWAGETFEDRLPSAALGRDLNCTVYVPDGYKDQPGPFPFIYLLHGAGGDERGWLRKGGTAETMDGLMKRGQMRPTLVVMPTAGPHSWWVDARQGDQAETAPMQDQIPFVEAKYKVTKERKGRAVGGLSMGGYGALNLALKYPDRFCGAALISPAVYDPLPPETSSARKARPFVQAGQFDAAAWKAHSDTAFLERYAKGSPRVAIWIDSGDHDHLGIAALSANLYWRLFQIQPKSVELRIVDGDHEWMVFRDALPDALQYVDRRCALGD
jgi:S-formylglutathione hydrolase FrmB